jgi:uncharacterized surface protein with fasciclin (FAS1) repeats
MDAPLEHLVERLDRRDTDELRRAYRQGELRWLAPRLGPILYQELGARIDGGDVEGIRALLVQRGVLPTGTGPGDGTGGGTPARRTAAGWAAMLPLVIALALVAVALSRCDDGGSGSGDSVAARIADQPDLTTLAGLLERPGLAGRLEVPGPLTVFAPTDRAFAALPLTKLSALRAADGTVLAALLDAHTVADDIPHSGLAEVASTLVTVDGRPLGIEVTGDTVTVGGAEVTLADLRAANGVVHAVDGVLIDLDELFPPLSRPST